MQGAWVQSLVGKLRSTCMRAQLFHPCPTFCDPEDHNLPSSSVHRILQVRMLEWVATPFPRRSSWPRDQTLVSSVCGRFFTAEAPGKPKDLHGKATHTKSFLNFHLCLKQHALLHLWPFCYKQASDKPPVFLKCRVAALLILWLDTVQPGAAGRTLPSVYRTLTHGFLC